MSISRRSFLRALAVGVAVVATRPVLSAVEPVLTLRPTRQDGLTLDHLRAAKQALLRMNSAPVARFSMVVHPAQFYDLADDVTFLGIKMVPLNASSLRAFDRRGAA